MITTQCFCGCEYDMSIIDTCPACGRSLLESVTEKRREDVKLVNFDSFSFDQEAGWKAAVLSDEVRCTSCGVGISTSPERSHTPTPAVLVTPFSFSKLVEQRLEEIGPAEQALNLLTQELEGKDRRGQEKAKIVLESIQDLVKYFRGRMHDSAE